MARENGALKILLLVLPLAVVVPRGARAQSPSVVAGNTSALDEAKLLNAEVVRLYHEGKYAQATPPAERALALREGALGQEHPLVATSLHNLAGLYDEQGAYAKAESLFLRALRIREMALGPKHPAVAQSLTNLAELYNAQGAYAKAEPLFERAALVHEHQLGTLLVTLSEPRKRQMLARVRSEVEMLASFHAQDVPGDATALRLALTVALQRKGRVLDELAGDRAALRRNLTPALQAEFDVLTSRQAKLAALREVAHPEQAEAVRALAEEVEQGEVELSRKSFTFQAQIKPLTIERVQTMLSKDAALVEFVRYRRFDPTNAADSWKEAHYVAYMLRREGPLQWVSLGKATPLEKAVQTARRALLERDDEGHLLAPADEARRLLRALDALVFAPVRKLLGDVPHLLLAPDGVLHTVPFEALVDEQGHYLLERSLVTYLGSGRDLLRMGERPPSRSGPLVLAPDYGLGDTFPPLRGAIAEAEAVRKLFPQAQPLLGADATRQALLAVHGPHFALLSTHGFLKHPGLPAQPATSEPLPTPPLPHERGTSLRFAPPDEGVDPERALERAGLALAGANIRPDAIVNGRDLAALDLAGTKLVVLSACETGLGQLADGEGVYGLRRALAIAGAESQVTSLWSVNDEATGELIRTYFRGPKDGPVRGASAGAAGECFGRTNICAPTTGRTSCWRVIGGSWRAEANWQWSLWGPVHWGRRRGKQRLHEVEPVGACQRCIPRGASK
jgi:CHAT domain-containing protein